jgi:hypothetical protein
MKELLEQAGIIANKKRTLVVAKMLRLRENKETFKTPNDYSLHLDNLKVLTEVNKDLKLVIGNINLNVSFIKNKGL